ncbi:hypothetical protein [Brumimicrobium mesophilum]|uniref:hypothetical protein n=1 Tax=Brumimicrobium mesophilum TaxID=392717 RepID=UPI000D142001|nr:hypothetical protein [Brumimicrobium mesophilum]
MLFQILKKSPLLICAGAMLIFTSCNGEEPVDSNNRTESLDESQRSTPVLNNTGNQDANSNNAIQNQSIDVNSNNGAVKLNPPHGEPGHDCAIAVGQPLNSNGNTPAIKSPTINAPVSNQPNMNGNVKLNPAHGEPGHDCAIAVGAPLN